MKLITDEDYADLIGWAEYASCGVAELEQRYEEIHTRYSATCDLYVVELDDPSEFPTPTWGPFEHAFDAMEWVEQRFGTTDCEMRSLDARTYALDDGRYITIKRLTLPSN